MTDRLKVTMRQVHKAGEKCFVDYSGENDFDRNPTTDLYAETDPA